MKKSFLRGLCLLLALLTVLALAPASGFSLETNALSNSEKYPGHMGMAYTAADVAAIVKDYYNAVTNNGAKNAFWNRDIRNDSGSSSSMTQLEKDTKLTAPKGENRSTWFLQRIPYVRAVSNTSCENNNYGSGGCKSNGFKGVGTENPVEGTGQSTNWQCQGFAAYMAWVVFGDRSFEYSAPIYGDDAKNVSIGPGDVLRINGHSIFVYAVENGYAKTIECNLSKAGGYCKIYMYTTNKDFRKASTLESKIRSSTGANFMCKAPLQQTWATNVEVKLADTYSTYNLYEKPESASNTLNNSPIPKGTVGVATKISMNQYGNYWYYVTVRGMSGWIYGGHLEALRPAPGAVTVSNLTNLTKYKTNSGSIDIKDKLKANGCTITEITGAIRNAAGAVANNTGGTKQQSVVSVICRSYSIKEGPINSKLTPKKMAAGLYRYTLDVDLKFRVTDGKKLMEKSFADVRVLDDWFESYKSSASSFAMTLDPNGGSCVQKEQLAYSGKAIGALPTPSQPNSKFLGWYTAKSGGSKVTETSTFTKAGTLYARWEGQHIHVEVIDKAVEATCTKTGLTEGKHCDSCKAVLIPQETVPKKDHSYTAQVTQPTCTQEGYTTYTCSCSHSYTANPTDKKPHSYQNGKCGVCGAEEPKAPADDQVLRIAGANRFETAFRLAHQLKKELKADKFENIIVASGATYADALPGSYLAAVKKAPILLSYTKGDFNDRAKAYIRENLVPGGTVYILGDVTAVPASMEQGLEGYTVKRLPGANRFETNMLILKEAGVKPGDEILICTGADYADALSASAVGKPILLVYKKLYDYQREFLEGLPGSTFCIIGGESAVRASIEEEIRTFGPTERLGGKDRLETSHKVAQRYFGNADGAVLAYGWNFPDGLCGGSLAYAKKMPLILSHSKEKLYGFTAEYTGSAGIKSGCVLGTGELIPDNAVRRIFGMAENAPITTAE